MSKIVKFWNLGKVQYDYSNKIQQFISKNHAICETSVKAEIVKKKSNGSNIVTKDTLLISEFDPVYTTGLRDCLSDAEVANLERLGAQWRRAGRGGLATFHGPGQLTAYPILGLRGYRPGARWYVCALEEVAIQTCDKLGIKAERSPHTGVWVGDSKICALGVHISRGVTSHGLAFNCDIDLTWFDHIVPCGVEGKGVTSVTKELKKKVTIGDVMPMFLKSFEEVFECRIENISESDRNNILNGVEIHS